jgi:hypothetical protein
MIAHPHNRPHTVDKQTGDFLHLLYELLFRSDHLELRVKQRTFETAAETKNSWRVVSITSAAIEHLRETESAKGLQRGHLLSRSDRAKYLFNRDVPLSRDELLQYFFEHDTVALVTRVENAKDGVQHWSKLHPVPEGLFTEGSFSIYARKRKELKWIKTLPGSSAA